MKVKIVNDGNMDSISWTVVKVFVALVAFSLVLPPVSRGWSNRYENGLKTVLPARIRAAQINTLSLEFTANATAVSVRPGDQVVAGQILAEFESSEVRQMLDRAELRMALATERMKPAAKRKSPLLDEQYEGAVMARDAARARMNHYSLDAYEASYDHAMREVANLTKLVEQHLATAQDLEGARQQEAMDLRNLRAAKENRLRLKQEADAADSQLRMAKIQRDERPDSDAPSTSARLDFEDAQMALRAAQEKLASLHLRAPRAGTVLQVSVEPGARVIGGVPIFQLADLSTLVVEVPVTGKMAQEIERGSKVKIAMPTDPPMELNAKVSEVLLVPDHLQQSHVVRIVIPNPAPATILVGMEGVVEFPHGGRS